MSRNEIITANYANKISADSALPNFLQKIPDDSDSNKTWREVASVHGAVIFNEAGVFRPLIRPKAQNGFVYRGGDDDLTMEEAMKKGIAPNGMKPAWSPEARKRYEACVEPHIEDYKKAVDKINKTAGEEYDQQKKITWRHRLVLPLCLDCLQQQKVMFRLALNSALKLQQKDFSVNLTEYCFGSHFLGELTGILTRELLL